MTRNHPIRTQGSGPSLQPSTPDDQQPRSSQPTEISAAAYTNPFLTFISNNPTVFHTVSYFSHRLESYGFTKLSERNLWTSKLQAGGKYYVERNGSALIAFAVGSDYESGNGAAIVAAHIDALTARLKPISKLETKAGFVQLGVAPYAGAFNSTWWDRDLGIGGRVLVRDGLTGKISTKLVKLGWPIARIPTLAPHFGAASAGPFNQETQMVPVIGLDDADVHGKEDARWEDGVLGGAGTFTSTQPERLVKTIAGELGIQDCRFLRDTTLVAAKLSIMQTAVSSTGNSSSSIPNPPSSAA